MADAFSPLPEMQIAMPTATMEEWILWCRALYGNDSQIGAIERAGARAMMPVVKGNIAATAENPTGRLAGSARVYRNRKGGYGVALNRAGDYGRNAGKRGGVRYAMPHHQGHQRNNPTKFLHRPQDPTAAVAAAMHRQHDKQGAELTRRAQTLSGYFGKKAEAELRAKMSRAGQKLMRGRWGTQTQGGRAAATLKVLEREGAVRQIAIEGASLLSTSGSTVLDGTASLGG